ncbi:MAG: ABC transporter permease [Conexivisphaera sp.]
MLVTPTPREALILGKALSAEIHALSQVVIICALTVLVGAAVDWNPMNLGLVLVFAVLDSALFSTFSLMVASLVKTRERFMRIGQVLTMLLFLASNAVYLLSIVPARLRWSAEINPLTYEVDALRGLTVIGEVSAYGIGLDLAIL